jgi:hypothetical protein
MSKCAQFALLVLMVGCGVQRGLFSTSGEHSQALLPHPGCIDIVSGQALSGDDTSDQNLLYLVIVLPGLKARGSGSSSDYGKYVTTLTFHWETEAGSVSVPVQWDRQRDTVLVSHQTFVRCRGNVLVVRREADGALTARQMDSLSHVNGSAVLQHLRQQLPNDELIASLRLQDAK